MTILELMKGRKMMVETDMKATVELTIDKVVENNHSQDLEPGTAANDWYPAQRTWTSVTVYFTNGSKKTFDSLKEISVHE